MEKGKEETEEDTEKIELSADTEAGFFHDLITYTDIKNVFILIL
jgi:hypothetical protein